MKGPAETLNAAFVVQTDLFLRNVIDIKRYRDSLKFLVDEATDEQVNFTANTLLKPEWYKE